jgi:hypothetical protein
MDELYQFRRQCARQRRKERSINFFWVPLLPLVPLLAACVVAGLFLAMVLAKAFELWAAVLRRAQDHRGDAPAGFTMALEIAAYNLRHRFLGDFRATPFEPIEYQQPNENQRDLARFSKGTRIQRFLSAAGFFLPREMREPFWEHLLTDCAEMRKQGRSGLFVAFAMVSQFVVLIANFLKETLLDLAVGIVRGPRNI